MEWKQSSLQTVLKADCVKMSLSRLKHALQRKYTQCTSLQLEVCAARRSGALSSLEFRLLSQAAFSHGGQEAKSVSHMLTEEVVHIK